MKRDLDLYRTLLLELERKMPPGQWGENLDTEGYTEEVVDGHLRLLVEAGFVEGNVNESVGGIVGVYCDHITHEGHDFLQSIEDDTVWVRTKERLKNVGGTAALSVVKSIAVEVSKGIA